jgi:hypothetical protein
MRLEGGKLADPTGELRNPPAVPPLPPAFLDQPS